MCWNKCKNCPDKGYQSKYDILLSISQVEIGHNNSRINGFIEQNEALRARIKELEAKYEVKEE